MSKVMKLAERIRKCVVWSRDVENLGEIVFYAIEYRGNFFAHTISLHQHEAKDNRSASWWDANANDAKVVKLKIVKA